MEARGNKKTSISNIVIKYTARTIGIIILVVMVFVGWLLFSPDGFISQIQNLNVGWEEVKGSKQLAELRAEERQLDFQEFLTVYKRTEEPQQIDNFYKKEHGAQIQIFVAGNGQLTDALEKVDERFVEEIWKHHSSLGSADQLENIKQRLEEGTMLGGEALYYSKNTELGEMFASVGDLYQDDRVWETPADYDFGFVIDISFV